MQPDFRAPICFALIQSVELASPSCMQLVDKQHQDEEALKTIRAVYKQCPLSLQVTDKLC